MMVRTADTELRAQTNVTIYIGDMDELKELASEIPEKTIYRVVLGEEATGNEQEDG